jgi:hypothetical protein
MFHKKLPYNEELHNLYSPPNIKMIKTKEDKMEDTGNVSKIVTGKPDEITWKN